MNEEKISYMPEHIRRNPFLDNIYRDVHDRDFSSIIAVTGQVGMGKSCIANYLGYALDCGQRQDNPNVWTSRFSLERCHFNTIPFVKDITARKENNKQFFPKGSAFILDEANVESGNTEWFSLRSKALAKALQTNRKFNYIMIFTAPEVQSIAKSVRRRINVEVEVLKKIKKDNHPYALCKIKYTNYVEKNDTLFGKFHRAFLPILLEHDNEGNPVYVYRKVKIITTYLPLIPKKLEEDYNVKKDVALANWYDKEMRDLQAFLKAEKGAEKESNLDLARKIVDEMKDVSVLFQGKKLVEADVTDFLKAKGVKLSDRDWRAFRGWMYAHHAQVDESHNNN